MEESNKTTTFIKVLIVEPNKEPALHLIKNDLETLQEIVDGLIQIVSLPNGIDIILNEEGKIMGLPFNRVLPKEFFETDDILCGNLILAGLNEETGETISLTDEQIENAMEIFSLDKHLKEIEILKEKLNLDEIDY